MSSTPPHPHSSSSAIPGKRAPSRRGESVARRSAIPGWAIAVSVIVGILVVVQLLASPTAKAWVNRKLAHLPEYTGHVEAVRIALWRGDVDVMGLALFKRDRNEKAPFLRIQKASFRFAPSALFKGKLGGTAVIDGSELNVIKKEADNTEKKPPEKVKAAVQEKKAQLRHWQDVLRESFPMDLSRVELRNARIHFVDRSRQPNVDVGVEKIFVVARDLQNRPDAGGDPMPAKVDVTGLMTGNGKLKISIQLDPLARQPRFAINFELREQALPPLNVFLNAYADADVSRGTFELYSEINAQNGSYNGYVKPLFHDLDFRNASDKNKSAGKLLKEKVVSAVISILKNDDTQQVATKAPFSGNFADNDVDIWTTIVNLLRNAFIQAIRGGFEGQTPHR